MCIGLGVRNLSRLSILVPLGEWLAVGCAAVFLAGCVGTAGEVRTGDLQADREVVAMRAQSKWDALKEGNFDAAYGFVSPASRSVMTIEAFRRRSGMVTWKEARVKEVSCQSSDACVVEVDVQYVYRARGAIPLENMQIMRENWGRASGQWWYIPPELF